VPHSRAAVYDGAKPKYIEVRDFEVPELGPAGELVLRTRLCGVCGSDLHRWSWSKETPVILGHEILGVVEKVPPGWLSADGAPLQVGDLVVPETRIPCHTCQFCRGVGSRPSKQIDYSHCPSQRGLGGIRLHEMPLLSGGWSDYVELPHGAIVHKIPPEVDSDEAVLLEPFSIGMKASRVADVNQDDTVLVLGPGPIGLLTTVACHAAGAKRVILAGREGDEARLALGRELGAHATIDVGEGDPVERLKAVNDGRLATRVIEATGAAAAIELGLTLLARGGVLVTVGGHHPEARITLNPSDLVWTQREIRGMQLGALSYEGCIGVLASRRYPLRKMLTHRFELPQVQQALETFAQRGACIKPVIVFE
jgi:threonine dehydrogenase-like Zn-dependent dehydrogenase